MAEMSKFHDAGGDGYSSNEEWAEDTYERADFEKLADRVEALARRKHLPEKLRVSMIEAAWDMKCYARRDTIL